MQLLNTSFTQSPVLRAFARQWRPLASLPLLCLLAAHTPVHAQKADGAATGVTSPWEVSVGLGIARAPEYEGGKRAVSGLVPDLNIAYRTQSWGTFGVGSKSRGVSWTILDKEAYSFGIALQGSTERVDNKDGTVYTSGSKRLAGMGKIKSSAEVGVFGHYVLGVPLSLEIVRGLGNGKVNATNFSVDGHKGTRVELGAEVPYEVTSALTLSVSPNLSLADGKYMQTYFGVSPAQSARSGFRPFTAKRGIKSAGVSFGANYKFSEHWSANAAVSFSQLRGDAAKSPIVEKKLQSAVVAGVAYTF